MPQLRPMVVMESTTRRPLRTLRRNSGPAGLKSPPEAGRGRFPAKAEYQHRPDRNFPLRFYFYPLLETHCAGFPAHVNGNHFLYNMVGYGAGRLNLQVFQNPVVVSCTFLWLLHSIFQQFFPEPWFLKFYLNDLLCMPMVLGAAVFLQRNVVLRQPAYALTAYQIGIIVVYWSVMFEIAIPNFVPRYTADLWDVFMYFTGAFLFYFFGNAAKTNLVRKVA